jgi:hypothetical protein
MREYNTRRRPLQIGSTLELAARRKVISPRNCSVEAPKARSRSEMALAEKHRRKIRSRSCAAALSKTINVIRVGSSPFRRTASSGFHLCIRRWRWGRRFRLPERGLQSAGRRNLLPHQDSPRFRRLSVASPTCRLLADSRLVQSGRPTSTWRRVYGISRGGGTRGPRRAPVSFR